MNSRRRSASLIAARFARAIAMDLVTRYRLRLADQRDGRLGVLAGNYTLAAAMWNGPRAALVAVYEPPADPAAAGRDLAERCDVARRWGLDRIHQQGAQVCDILLIALGPLAGTLAVATTAGDPVRLGVAWVDVANGNAGAVLPIPPGLPPVGELRFSVTFRNFTAAASAGRQNASTTGP